jgi:putative tryptophan/tyrosine transport system substrate-binding protein
MTIRTIIFSAAAAVFLICSSPITNAGAAEKIAVLVSSKDAPFEEALKGFQGYLDKAAVQAEYEVHKLDGSAAKAGQAVQAVKKSGARLVLTLGSLATDAAVKDIPDIPIVACMVLRAEGLKKSPNVTGVGLEFSLEVQTSWLQVLLPTAKNVGVIYNSDENKTRIEAAGRIMQNMGLKLVAQEVRSSQDVPAALEGLNKKVDVLWGVADTVAMTPQTAKTVLPFSVKNNIPLIGPSPTWVKAGALYSLEWDYADIGAQAGDMAAKVLKGAPPSAIAAASPRKVYYALNLKTAQEMKVNFSDQLVRGARHTFTGEK